MAAFIAWLILFHDDKEVIIVANTKDVAKNLLSKVKLVFNHVPDWMYLADVTENNVHSLRLSNGSAVQSIARSDNAGRSHAVSLLVLDEAAHIDRMDELWKGAASTVSTGGKVVALSTPKGIANWFHEYFTKAEAGEIDWHPMTTHWWENPVYAEGLVEDPTVPGGKTSPWFKKTTEGWSRQAIAQELLTSFVESGENFFSVDCMDYYNSICRPPLEKVGVDKNLWIWEQPKTKYKYLISADSSHGSGVDYSTAHVMELKEMEVVAEYRGKLPPDLFGDFLVELAERYNNAYINPESQGIGNVTGYRIKNLGYRNLCYFDKDTSRLIDQWSAEYKGVAPGQPMTVKERPMIVAKAEEYLRKRHVKIYSRRFVNEMNTFIIKNGKPQAQKGSNDDLVMSLAIGIWARDMCPEFRGSASSAEAIALINATQRSSKSYEATNSREFHVAQHKKKIKKMMDDQKMPLHNRSSIYSSWLYKTS